MPKDSAWELRCLLPIAPTTLMNSCFRIFKKEAAASGADAESELSVQAIGSKLARLRNDKKE